MTFGTLVTDNNGNDIFNGVIPLVPVKNIRLRGGAYSSSSKYNISVPLPQAPANTFYDWSMAAAYPGATDYWVGAQTDPRYQSGISIESATIVNNSRIDFVCSLTDVPLITDANITIYLSGINP